MVSHQHSDLLRFVSDELMAQPGVPEALKVIGIEQATPSLELTAFIRGRLRSAPAGAWEGFWTLVRGFADVNDAIGIIAREFGNQDPSGPDHRGRLSSAVENPDSRFRRSARRIARSRGGYRRRLPCSGPGGSSASWSRPGTRCRLSGSEGPGGRRVSQGLRRGLHQLASRRELQARRRDHDLRAENPRRTARAAELSVRGGPCGLHEGADRKHQRLERLDAQA